MFILLVQSKFNGSFALISICFFFFNALSPVKSSGLLYHWHEFMRSSLNAVDNFYLLRLTNVKKPLSHSLPHHLK